MNDTEFKALQGQFADLFSATNETALTAHATTTGNGTQRNGHSLCGINRAGSPVPSQPALRLGSMVETQAAPAASWQQKSSLPAGQISLSTIGRNHLAGCVASHDGLVALPQAAGSIGAPPSLLVCDIAFDGTLGSRGLSLTPKLVEPNAPLCAVAWFSCPGSSATSKLEKKGNELLLAAAWVGSPVTVWRVVRGQGGGSVTGVEQTTPRHAQRLGEYYVPADEQGDNQQHPTVRSLAWHFPGGKRMCTCGSSRSLPIALLFEWVAV